MSCKSSSSIGVYINTRWEIKTFTEPFNILNQLNENKNLRSLTNIIQQVFIETCYDYVKWTCIVQYTHFGELNANEKKGRCCCCSHIIIGGYFCFPFGCQGVCSSAYHREKKKRSHRPFPCRFCQPIKTPKRWVVCYVSSSSSFTFSLHNSRACLCWTWWGAQTWSRCCGHAEFISSIDSSRESRQYTITINVY